MKMILRLIIILLMGLCTSIQTLGQTDTLKQFKEKSAFQVDEKFRDRTLSWTINAKGVMRYDIPFYFNYGIGTRVEYKLSNNHSLEAGFGLFLNSDTYYYSSNASIEFDLGYRYYHNLRRRMSKGLTGNNFSANYILISPYFGLRNKPYSMQNYHWDFDQGTWAVNYSSGIGINPGIRLGYGLQRSFWGKMNFDINGGIQFWGPEYYASPADRLYLQFSIGYIIK